VQWLHEYLRKEAVQDAMERGLKEMQNYADNEAKLNGDFTQYFVTGATNRIVHHIIDGRMSPWIIYNCKTGIDWLSSLTEEPVSLIMPWIDPDYWQKKFNDNSEDVRWVKNILNEAGL
jgi:hypothetical protein